MTTLDEMVDIFELLGDWDQRYAYLTELGEQLPAMSDADRTEKNKVKGCMSQVWVSAHRKQADNSIYFSGDCDTSIIKGVLALLIQLTENMTSDEIKKLDVDEFFERLKLDENLSPNRHVGVYAIVDLMKQQVRVIEKNSCAA